MPCLIVTPLSQLVSTAKRYNPRSMITLINASTPVIRPVTIPENKHLVLHFNDINQECNGLVAPSEEHVATLLQFVASWEQETPLLIHCFMGISRSTAAAFIAACALNPLVDEKILAWYLREKSPSATPNARLISLSDRLLSRAGRMTEAIKQIGCGCNVSEGVPFTLFV